MVLLGFVLFGLSINAQTNVSGFINANTTWDLNGSPYIVIGNSLLSHGYTLTINPGVVVKFNDSCVLQIDGELDAIGTSQNRITFTSNQLNPQPGDWGKIHFSDTCVNAVFDTLGNYVSGCIMKYCDVLYGGGIGFGEIHIESSSPYFSHCNISKSSAAGIYSHNTTYVIDSSLIMNNQGYGLYFANDGIIGSGLIINCDSIDNNYGGILLEQINNGYSNPIIKITHNYFISNSNNGAIVSYESQLDSLLISENLFMNNILGSGNVQSNAVITLDAYNYEIVCNNFINNQTEDNSVINIWKDDGGIISHNTFDGNNSSSGSSIFSEYNVGLGYEPFNDGTGALYFTDNFIMNNTSPNSACCFFKTFSYNFQSYHINNNEFLNNTGTCVIYFTGPQSGNNSYNLVEMKNNNLLDPGQIEVYNNIPYGSPNLYVDNNYWGTTDTTTIESRIYDFFQDGNLSVVYFLPVLDSAVAIDTTCTASILNGIKTINEPKNNSVLLYPNPTSGNLTLSYNSQLSILHSQFLWSIR